MNQKSLKGLKNLTSEFIKNPKLIDRLDDIRIRYAEITEKFEDPNTYKDRKLSEKLNKEKSQLEKPVKHFLDVIMEGIFSLLHKFTILLSSVATIIFFTSLAFFTLSTTC